MRLKDIFKKRTPVEQIKWDIERGKTSQEQIMYELANIFGYQSYVFYERTKKVKKSIKEYNARVNEIKEEINRHVNHEYTNQWCKDIGIKRLQMEKNAFSDYKDTINSRNSLLSSTTIAIIPKMMRMQEAFPDRDWSLTGIMKNALGDNIKEAVFKEIKSCRDDIYEYPTLKEMDMYRKFLITSWVVNYGVYADKDINMFNENGLIRGICTKFDGTYPLKAGNFTLDQIIQITNNSEDMKLFEEDIFADFIEVDYCGVV